MKLDAFVASRSPSWMELEDLVARASSQSGKLGPSEIQRLGALYRAAVADLAIARRRFPADLGTMRLTSLVHEAYGVVYSAAGKGFGPLEFVTRRLWQRVLQGGPCLAIAAGIFVVTGVLSFIWGYLSPDQASGFIPGLVVHGHPFRNRFGAMPIGFRSDLATQIFTHNIQIAVLAFVGGITFGWLTAIVLSYNAVVLGVLYGIATRTGQLGIVLSLTAPHGVLEMSGFVVASSTGFCIARTLLHPGNATRLAALRQVTPLIVETVIGLFLLFVVAGLVEGFLTPQQMSPASALAVGVVLGGGFWALVVWRGRGGPSFLEEAFHSAGPVRPVAPPRAEGPRLRDALPKPETAAPPMA